MASKTKTKRDRRVPMSSVLREILERRSLDPAGASLPSDAYVFGDDVGRRRRTIKDVWKIAQTSTYLGASLGADELDMQALEKRVGRTADPIVYVAFAS